MLNIIQGPLRRKGKDVDVPKMSLQASLDLSLVSLRSQLVDSSGSGRVQKWNHHLTTRL